MNVRSLFLLLGLAGCNWGTPAATSAIVEIRPADGELQDQLVARYDDAQKRHLHPFVQVYADWCAPCRAVRHEMDDPRMVAAFEGVYLVRVQYDPWKDALLKLLAGKTPGVPVFYEIEQDGKLGRFVDGGAWGADKAENIAPVLAAYFKGDPVPGAPASVPTPVVTQGAVEVQKIEAPAH